MKNYLAAVVAVILLLCISGCGNAATTYTQYVQAIMDCTYHADTAEYLRLTGASDEDALSLFRTEQERTAQLICAQMTVKPEMLPESTMKGYEELAGTLLRKVSYSIDPAVKNGMIYQVRLTSEPLDFWDISIKKVQTLYATRFSERFAKAQNSEKRLADLEAEWGAKVLEILTECADETSYKESISTIVTISANEEGHYSVTEQTWLYVDSLLLGLNPDSAE